MLVTVLRVLVTKRQLDRLNKLEIVNPTVREEWFEYLSDVTGVEVTWLRSNLFSSLILKRSTKNYIRDDFLRFVCYDCYGYNKFTLKNVVLLLVSPVAEKRSGEVTLASLDTVDWLCRS